MKARILLSGAIVLAAACGPSQEVQRQLEQLQVVSAEKDSLLQLVVENTRLMSEVSAELARVTPGGERLATGVESPYQLSRDSIVALMRGVTARVQDAEERLARSQRRVRRLGGVSDSLRTQIRQMETIFTELQTTLDNQKETIVSLNSRLEGLRLRNVQLAQEKAAVADSLRRVEIQANTAYFVIGTKDELKDQGIILEEGGSRFPLIFKRVGTTLVPAGDLDPSVFTAIDIREVAQIELPDANREYRIVSTQDLSALAEPVNDGRVNGTIRIADPENFWAGSRFLIVVRG